MGVGCPTLVGAVRYATCGISGRAPWSRVGRERCVVLFGEELTRLLNGKPKVRALHRVVQLFVYAKRSIIVSQPGCSYAATGSPRWIW